jgi:outer membrane protein OmpA-like peptidoglycan-associated protein
MPTTAPLRAAVAHREMPAGGTGKALDSEVRADFEPRFGHDFSRVRVHADSASAASAHSENSAAYTLGSDIFYGEGMYNPATDPGRQLLAHELTHVVQQQNDRGERSHGSHYEAEAEEAGRAVAGGGTRNVRLAAPHAIQRQELPKLSETKLAESASPTMAAVIGSGTLDNFVTGKSDLSADNKAKLGRTVENIKTLLQRYPGSTIHVTGHTDAVGKENDNQALGQSRADAVKAALLQMGIPEIAVQTESHGANDLLVRTTKAEGRNRRVQVYFEPSLIGRHAMTGGLSVGGTSQGAITPGTVPPADTSITGYCGRHPEICYGGGGPPCVPPGATQAIPDNTPYKRMDVKGINDAYASHGERPPGGDDLRAAWDAAYKRYRGLGFSEDQAVWLANKEVSATAAKEESRDNPNSIDRSNTEMQRQFPDSTTIGPGNIFEKKF